MNRNARGVNRNDRRLNRNIVKMPRKYKPNPRNRVNRKYPTIADESDIDFKQIVGRVEAPTERCGVFKFKVNFLKWK